MVKIERLGVCQRQQEQTRAPGEAKPPGNSREVEGMGSQLSEAG